MPRILNGDGRRIYKDKKPRILDDTEIDEALFGKRRCIGVEFILRK